MLNDPTALAETFYNSYRENIKKIAKEEVPDWDNLPALSQRLFILGVQAIVEPIRQELLEVEALETESHTLWDKGFTCSTHGNPSPESKEKYFQMTLTATRKHSEAMDKLRRIIGTTD
jgi:hypothetical protein